MYGAFPVLNFMSESVLYVFFADGDLQTLCLLRTTYCFLSLLDSPLLHGFGG